MGVLEIFEEGGLRHGLHWGQTVGVQEVKGPGAAVPREQWLRKAPAASLRLVERIRGTGPHSVRSEGEKCPFQAGTGNRGVSPHNLVDSLRKYHSKGELLQKNPALHAPGSAPRAAAATESLWVASATSGARPRARALDPLAPAARTGVGGAAPPAAASRLFPGLFL